MFYIMVSCVLHYGKLTYITTLCENTRKSHTLGHSLPHGLSDGFSRKSMWFQPHYDNNIPHQTITHHT